MDKLLARYRRSINPPWNLKDYFNLVLSLAILIAIPLLFLYLHQQTIKSQAQTIQGTLSASPTEIKRGYGTQYVTLSWNLSQSPIPTVTIAPTATVSETPSPTPQGNVGIGTTNPTSSTFLPFVRSAYAQTSPYSYYILAIFRPTSKTPEGGGIVGFLTCTPTASYSGGETGQCNAPISPFFGPGIFEFRIYPWDQNNFSIDFANATPIAISNRFMVGDSSQATVTSLSFTNQPYPLGKPITVQWNAIENPTPHDWIGLYLPGDPDNTPRKKYYLSSTDTLCTSTQGTTGYTSGRCRFLIPYDFPAANYEMRLFSDDSYNRLAVSIINPFDKEPAITTFVTTKTDLTPSASMVNPGQSIRVSWNSRGGSDINSKVSLHALGASDTNSVDWYYADCTKNAIWMQVYTQTGFCTFQIPANLALGNYEFRFFDTIREFQIPYWIVAKSIPVTVTNEQIPPPTPTPTPETDTSNPGVTIVYPQNFTISGSITGEAIATDDIGVTRVDFFLNNTTLLRSDNTAPYEFTWDTRTVSNGSHLITATAFDSQNKSGNSYKWVGVQNTDAAPTPTPNPNIQLNGTPTNFHAGSPGDILTVTWGNHISATANDWVGLFQEGSTNSVIAMYMGSCSSTPGTVPASDGSCVFQFSNVIPASGYYRLKMYRGTLGTAGNTLLAVSGILTTGTLPTATPTPIPTATPSPLPTATPTPAGDTTPPSIPTNLTATAAAYNRVNLSLTASTDNVGVTGYWIIRNGITITSSSTTAYTDTTVNASTTYSYQVIAFDAAGNNSAASTSASVTTPQAPDTQAPSAPTNLSASPVSTSQINLSWTGSTDNIGVTGYDLYRNSVKVATVTGTSFGDTGLLASTTYSYFVKARDAADNVSINSNTISAKTQAPTTTGNITGTISSSAGGVVSGASVSYTIKGGKRTYTTNTQGVYTILNLTPGSYALTFNATGYTSQNASITVTAGVTTTKNVTLVKKK